MLLKKKNRPREFDNLDLKEATHYDTASAVGKQLEVGLKHYMKMV